MVGVWVGWGYRRGGLWEEGRCGGGGGCGWVTESVCLGIIYQFYCFLVLLVDAIAPHLAPPAPRKPRSLSRRRLSSIKLCSPHAIKSQQLRVNRWKVWHFAFDWRWIQSDGPDRRIQAWIWIYFFPLMFPHSPHNPSSAPTSCFPCCLILPLPEVVGPCCRGVCPTPHLILNHYLTV